MSFWTPPRRWARIWARSASWTGQRPASAALRPAGRRKLFRAVVLRRQSAKEVRGHERTGSAPTRRDALLAAGQGAERASAESVARAGHGRASGGAQVGRPLGSQICIRRYYRRNGRRLLRRYLQRRRTASWSLPECQVDGFRARHERAGRGQLSLARQRRWAAHSQPSSPAPNSNAIAAGARRRKNGRTAKGAVVASANARAPALKRCGRTIRGRPANPPPPTISPLKRRRKRSGAYPATRAERRAFSTLISGMPPLERGVTWEIYKVQMHAHRTVRAAEAPLWVGGGGQAKAKLPPGGTACAWLTVSRRQQASSRRLREGRENGTARCGHDRGRGAAGTERPARRGSILCSSQPKTRGRRARNWAVRAERPALFHLNTGDYVLSAFAGLAKLEAPVKVARRKSVRRAHGLECGHARDQDLRQSGVGQTRPSLASDHPVGAGSQKRRRLARSLALHIACSFRRAAIASKSVYGNAREERVVTVDAGQTTAKTVILNAGEAKVSLPPANPTRSARSTRLARIESWPDRARRGRRNPLHPQGRALRRGMPRKGRHRAAEAGADHGGGRRGAVRKIAGVGGFASF